MKNEFDIRDEIDAIYDLMDEDDPVDRAKIDALEWVIGQAEPPTEMEGTGHIATEEEIEKCIELLKIDKGELPEYSLFGDPNWKMFDAQIEILQWVISK